METWVWCVLSLIVGMLLGAGLLSYGAGMLLWAQNQMASSPETPAETPPAAKVRALRKPRRTKR